MTESDDSTEGSGQLMPVSGARALEREERSFEEIDDDSLMSLIETYQRVMQHFTTGGTLVAAAIIFGTLVTTGDPGVSGTLLLGASVFGWLGARYYLRGEAKRLGLSNAGLKEFHRRRWKLTLGAKVSESKSFHLPAEEEKREAALRQRVAWLRALPPEQ